MSLLVLTTFVFVITFLEAVDPGIASSFFPVPLLWLGLIVILLRERQTVLSHRMRRGLTIAVCFFTMALITTHIVAAGSIGIIVLILGGATSALLAWCATDPSYVHNPLSQDCP